MGSNRARPAFVVAVLAFALVLAACTGTSDRGGGLAISRPSPQVSPDSPPATSGPAGASGPGPTDPSEPLGPGMSGSPPAPTPTVSDADRRLLVVWIGGEIAPATVAAVRAVHGVAGVAAVGEGTLWLTGPERALGAAAGPGAEIPIDAASADPGALRRVLGDRAWLAALANGEAVVSDTSAALRRSGRGDDLQFAGGASFRIGAVATDRAVGAHEVFLPAADGARLGMGSADYLLVRVAGAADPAATERAIEHAVPTSPGHGVRVRSQAQTPYLRRADGVMPPEWSKVYFGEFAATPTSGGISIDPAWVRRNIVTAQVPIIGHVTCNRSLIAPLRAALQAIRRSGNAKLVDPAHYGGCFAERLIRGSTSQISQHAYGAAVDINVSTNPLGAIPTQDPRVVGAFHREGFVWGGDFLRQDGMHFEYGCPATRQLPERTNVPESLAGLALCPGA